MLELGAERGGSAGQGVLGAEDTGAGGVDGGAHPAASADEDLPAMGVVELLAPLEGDEEGREDDEQQCGQDVEDAFVAAVERVGDGAELLGVEVFGGVDAVAADDEVALVRHNLVFHGVVPAGHLA